MHRNPIRFFVLAAAIASISAAACGGTEQMIQTVVVEKPIERQVVQTVLVEKPIERQVIQTVLVEKPIEKQVLQTVVVEKEVKTVVTATAVPASMSADGSIRKAPTGQFVLAQNEVIAPVLIPALAGGGQEFLYHSWGIVDYPLDINTRNEVDASISLLTSWTVAPDQSKVTWELRPGVRFHSTWGELTAEDIVFSYNSALRQGSRFYGLQGVGRWMDRMEVVDKYRGVMFIKVWNPRWALNLSNAQTHVPWIVPKRLFDTRGEVGGVDTAIGTGPYRVISWKSNDQIVLEAVDHWRVVPKTKTMRVVEIKDPLAMQAAFLVGEVDIAPIATPLIKDTFTRIPGSTITEMGEVDTQFMQMTGNYWLKGKLKHRTDPNAQFPRRGYKPDDKHPWIGDIDDPAHMEKARKVRLAMAMAVDQKSIVKKVIDGFGVPHSVYTGFKSTDAEWNKDWLPAYDPKAAKALLSEAGYPSGFSFELALPSGVLTIDDQMGFAVAQMWREIGLNPVIDNGTYASTRDRRFDGVDNIPRQHRIFTGDIDDYKCGSFGGDTTFHGLELPTEILSVCERNRTEPDRSKRIANNVAVQDYLSKWVLTIPIGAKATYFMTGPAIVSWDPHKSNQPFFVGSWTVEVRRK